jgi:HSP20 family protein
MTDTALTHTQDPQPQTPVATAQAVDAARPRSFATPLVDVLESDAELLLVMDVPGVKQGDVHLRYEGDTLYLEATRDEGTHAFRRTFNLSERVDPEGIQAELNHGVLTVHLPKVAKARAREIPVRFS